MASWEKKEKKKLKKGKSEAEPLNDIYPSHLEEKYGPYRPIQSETFNKNKPDQKNNKR
jgi:hypothetical protein